MIGRYKFVFNRKNLRLVAGKKALVQLRITVGGDVRYYTTGIYLEKKQWAGVDKEWVVNTLNARDYNTLLENIYVKLRAAEVKAIGENKPLSHEQVERIIRGKEAVGSFRDFLTTESQQRNDIKVGTREHAEGLARKLEAWGLTKFADLTIENIKWMDTKLRADGKKDSTVDKFHKVMITYINRAIQIDLISADKNPYLKFKRKPPKYLDRKYLTAEELDKIEGKEMAIPRLQQVKDWFIFCCYTGLSYSDLEALKPNNIVKEGSRSFIKLFREKTEERSIVYLFDKSKELLKKYKGRRAGYCFPVMTNVRMNAYLKEIATLAGVEKNLTVHMARHTFATTIMLGGGASKEVTQKSLGHASIRTTEIYAQMLHNRVGDEMEKIEGKQTDKPSS